MRDYDFNDFPAAVLSTFQVDIVLQQTAFNQHSSESDFLRRRMPCLGLPNVLELLKIVEESDLPTLIEVGWLEDPRVSEGSVESDLLEQLAEI